MLILRPIPTHSLDRFSGACQEQKAGLVTYLARRISRYTVREIADHFWRNSVTVSEAMTKVEEHLWKNKKFARDLKLVVEGLVKGEEKKYRITEA